jgi:hypothetical protein
MKSIKHTLCAAAAGLVLAQPAAQAGGHAADPITGLWLATATLTNCTTGEPLPFPGATFEAMALFGADGTLHNTDQNSPLVRSAAFGQWQRVDGRRYRFAFKVFRYDATGTLPAGWHIVRHTVVLSRDGKRYSSKGSAEFYDVSGTRLLPDGCSTAVAKRFR